MAYIPEDKIEEIKSQIDIVSVISDYVELKQSGSNFIGLCPFHNEKTPSFTVSSEKGIFHCFGCGEGGDAITFIMKKNGLSYPEAIRFLADKLGIFLDTGKIDKEKYNYRKKLLEINNEAKLYFFHNILTNDTPKLYLKNRGIRNENINKFLLGYADGRNDGLYRHLTKKGYKEEDLLELGLIKKSQYNNGYYDTYRDRLIFPLLDTRKNIIGFGGRTLVDSKAKYINSPESIVYHKGSNIYGITNLVNVNKYKKVLLVEGYMDVISLSNYGVDYSIACLGTALTENQAKLISRYCKNIFVCYDGDNAGMKATEKAIDIFKKLDINVKIVQIPDGKDPDDYIRKYGKDSFENLIDNALDAIMYRYSMLHLKYNLKEIDEKVAFLDDLSNLLSDIDREIIRNEYIERICKDIDIDIDALKKDVEEKYRQKNNKFQSTEVIKTKPNILNRDVMVFKQGRKIVFESMRYILFNRNSLEKIEDISEYFSKITKIWDNIFSFAKEYYENHEEDNFIKKADTENFYKSDASMDRLIESIYDTSLPNYYRREEELEKFIKLSKIYNLTLNRKEYLEELELLSKSDMEDNEVKETYKNIVKKIMDVDKTLKELDRK